MQLGDAQRKNSVANLRYSLQTRSGITNFE